MSPSSSLSSGIFKVNGETLSSQHVAGSAVVYQLNRVLFRRQQLVDEAIRRMAQSVGESDPLPSAPLAAVSIHSHLLTAHIPALKNTVSFALRSVGAGRFASIWTDLKADALKCEEGSTVGKTVTPSDGDFRLLVHAERPLIALIFGKRVIPWYSTVSYINSSLRNMIQTFSRSGSDEQLLPAAEEVWAVQAGHRAVLLRC